MNLCLCGCGQEVSKEKNKYINRHSCRGKEFSADHRKKLSEANKGHEPPNKGKKGLQVGWNKGIPCSEETKQKISQTKKERYRKEDNPMYGKHHTEETKKKLSEAKIGKDSWNKGLKGCYTQSEESNKKRSESLKGKLAGNKNPAWKGGRQSKAEKLRKSDEYKIWVKQVYERDDYLCHRCNTGGKLIAHHIINFSKLLEENQYLFDISNGITFCKDCHKQFHRKYTMKNNNVQQIFEFIYLNNV